MINEESDDEIQDLRFGNWNKVTVDGKMAIAKFRTSSDGYGAMLCDGIITWQEKLNATDIAIRNRDLNPNVEASSEALLGHVRATLLSQQSDVSSKIHDDYGLILRCKVRIAGLPFNWKFHMRQSSRSTHAHHLTAPLINMNAELSRRIDELYQLLKLKDGVINHLKGDGTQVPNLPRSLKNGDVPFDPETFWKDMDTSRAFHPVPKQCVPDFDAKCLQLHTQIMIKMQSSVGSDQQNEANNVAGPTLKDALTESAKENTVSEADVELQRRIELEKRRAEEVRRKAEASKKKKLNL